MQEFNIDEIESIIGYNFKNKQLLTQAFTRSDMVENGRQRGVIIECSEVLELIGDRILYVIVMNEIIKSKTTLDNLGFHSIYNEGELSNAFVIYTCKEYLSSRIEELKLDKYLITIEKEITTTMQEDLFESLVGAMYLDSNYDIAAISKVVIDMLSFDKESFSVEKSPLSILKEYCDKHQITHPLLTFEDLETVFVGRLSLPELGIELSSYDKSKYILARRLAQMAYNKVGAITEHSLPTKPVTLDNAVNVLQELAQKRFIDKADYNLSFDYNTNLWTGYCEIENLPYMISNEYDKVKITAKKKLSLKMYNKIIENYSFERKFNQFNKNTYFAVENNKFIFYVHETTCGDSYEMTKYPGSVKCIYSSDDVLDNFINSPRFALRKFIRDIYKELNDEYKAKIDELPDTLLSEDVSVYQDFIDEVIASAK